MGKEEKARKHAHGYHIPQGLPAAEWAHAASSVWITLQAPSLAILHYVEPDQMHKDFRQEQIMDANMLNLQPMKSGIPP